MKTTEKIIIALSILSCCASTCFASSDGDVLLKMFSNFDGNGEKVYENLNNFFRNQSRRDILHAVDDVNNKIREDIQRSHDRVEDKLSLSDLLFDLDQLTVLVSAIGHNFEVLMHIRVNNSRHHINERSKILANRRFKLYDIMGKFGNILMHSSLTSYLRGDLVIDSELKDVPEARRYHSKLIDRVITDYKIITAQFYVSVRMIFDLSESLGEKDHTDAKMMLTREVQRGFESTIAKFKEIKSSASRFFEKYETV